MSAVVDPRKRSREEDVNEFMPLSKRINNLHLNNNNGGVGFSTEHHHPAVVGMHMPILEGHQANFAQCSSSSSSSGSTCHSIPSGGSSPSNGGTRHMPSHQLQDTLIVNGETLGEYCPDLAEHENPHYFNRNKVLYELYVERMRRVH
ncbi:AAEL011665-PA [Aedes aegypti]|uniref:Possible transcription factor n=2 Tax=Aedes aegypti TaxID=7159 RepID=Q1HQK9_AEDAE|nr:uncharacterized protein LOC5575108 [Aedes aegypti]ABF18468.1 possible transcription factor [Aedes aegypti]EAT36246.1 AAEL011665-PA [Aedes aegypti]